MPFVQVKVIEGVFSADQKKAMLQKVTEAMISVEGEALRKVTTVVIEEVKQLDWAIGGQPLSADDVKALARGASKKVAENPGGVHIRLGLARVRHASDE